MKKYLLMLVLACATAAHAEEKPVPQEGTGFMSAIELAKYQTVIGRVQDYLSGLTTITSEFTQTAPDGTLTTGKFYLQRPEKMRWQYNPPTPVLMVSNGNELVYYDYDLDQTSRIPLDSTLVGFLARKKITFDDTVGIRAISAKNGVIRISVAQIDKPSEGELTLELSDKPMQIKNMVVKDATGQVTTVALNNARFGGKLDDSLFVFKQPKREKH